ncbi:MAG: FAD-dependent oxidoreductase, partial [Sphaerochaetaceae bacterium]|nr:FAD-dependent oxidoreductase [Sphaerochaetaceae bacterium]
MKVELYDVVIVGSGPAGMGAAFEIANASKKNLKILMIDQEQFSTGGMRNDCKMNFTYPIGFPEEYWSADQANSMMDQVIGYLRPDILPK